MADFPYEDRFAVNRALPEHGRPRDEILAELQAMAKEEDAVLGDRASARARCTAATTTHYDFMNRGVRAVRARERAPARHVPEHDASSRARSSP